MTTTLPSTPRDLDRMLHPDEARKIVLSHAKPLEVEHVPIDQASWRVLAEDVVAQGDQPPFAAATMDGYAVLAADSSPWREIIGVQTAGKVLDLTVSEGYTVRITTGAPVPPGADAVVKVESTELMDDHVVVHQEEVASGENIRRIGADIQKGSLVLKAGTVLGPGEIGLLASMGLTPLSVRRRPRVSVLSTGDELADPGEAIELGQIYDSNRISLRTALQAEGAEIVWSGKAPDQRDELERFFQERIADSDIVITSGGVSMGELDLIKAILTEIAEVHFRKIFLKPGKPLNFATSGSTLIFGLPGNPVSALVGFEVFIRPVLGIMTGKRQIDRPRVKVALANPTPGADRIEYQRATVWVDEDGRLFGSSTGSQASSRLASFVGANALLVIPPKNGSFPAGEIVDALLLAAPYGERPG
jgi:molybdenum cofactor synthesis domain-containing protein